MTKIKVKVMVACPDCKGSGIDQMDASMFCPLCDGKKVLPMKDVPSTIRHDYGSDN